MTLSSNLDDINKMLNKAFLTLNVSLESMNTVTTIINVASSVRNIYMGSLVGNIKRKIYIQKISGFDEFDKLVDLAFQVRSVYEFLIHFLNSLMVQITEQLLNYPTE